MKAALALMVLLSLVGCGGGGGGDAEQSEIDAETAAEVVARPEGVCMARTAAEVDAHMGSGKCRAVLVANLICDQRGCRRDS